MTHSEIQAESRRLQELAETLATQNRGTSAGFELLSYAILSGFAIAIAATLAFGSSLLFGLESSIIIFAALMAFLGCCLISWHISFLAEWQSKQFDAINALRLCVIDLSNRISILAPTDHVQ